MGIPISFEALVEGGVVESERIEFKASWDSEASLKTVCAFANDFDDWGGGYLVIGVSEEGDERVLVGLSASEADACLKAAVQDCKLIAPDYMPLFDVASYGGKLFVVVWACGGSVRPYSCPDHPHGKRSERHWYIRKGSCTVKPSNEQVRELYCLSNNVPFDDRPNQSATLHDLDKDLILSYLREVRSGLCATAETMDFVELCRSMNIAQGPPENVLPKNVGLLFFTLHPELYFPYAWIDVVEFPDGLGGDRIVEHSFKGPLHVQVREALRYLESNVIVEHVRKVPDKAEALRNFNYPYAAVEESLVNAVCHKGYDVREPVEVRVLPDRMEIVSFPGADRSISLEALRTYRAVSRHYRNRRIGEFLKELRLTEGRNTGFHKILFAMRANGSPDPLFETDEDRIYFLTTLPAWSEPESPREPKADLYLMDEREGELAYAGSGSPRELTERERRICDYLRKRPNATIAQLCDDLGLKPATVNRDVKGLRDANVLWREGSRKTGCWCVSLVG